MKTICLFCASADGHDPIYREEAKKLAILMAHKGIALAYGGANVGIMKVLADTAMEHGGEVIGVMPTALVEKEVAHKGITKLHQVESMAQRKELLISLSDAFITLPGGLGTLDELMEVMTLNQIGIIDKPCGILNTNGYYDDLLKFFERAKKEDFIKKKFGIDTNEQLFISNDPNQLLQLVIK